MTSGSDRGRTLMTTKTYPGKFASLLLVGALAATAVDSHAETTEVTGSLGRTAQTCIQLLSMLVGEGENCMYSGSGALNPVPLGPPGTDPETQNPGPWSFAAYYDSGNPNLPPFTSGAGGMTDYTPSAQQNDGKIEPLVNGSITVDGTGEDALISFELVFTSPLGGDILRHQGTVVDRYTSMTQVLDPWPVDSATPNEFGGFDYVIAEQGFPELLVFNDPAGSPCNGQAFGTMECGSSFDAAGPEIIPSPNRWTGRPGDAGLGSLEFNAGARTVGTLEGAACVDNQINPTGSTTPPCQSSKTSYAPRLELNGPNGAPGTNNVTAETVGWDNLLLRVSTNAQGNVVSAEGFDVQGYMVFGGNVACGSDPGATIPCNSWTSGYFTLVVPQATDDGPFDVVRGTPFEIDVLANDLNFNDPVTVSIEEEPQQGTAEITGLNPGEAADIRIVYTADSNAEGADSFVYTIVDANGTTSDSATVTLNILDLGANDDSATTTRNTEVIIPIGANDSFDGPVTVTVIEQPTSGTVQINGSGGPASAVTATYTPSGPAAGTPGPVIDSFVYEMEDDLLTDQATVTITINNTVPLAIAGTINSISTQGVDPVTRSGAFTAPGAGGSLGDLPANVTVSAQGSRGTASASGNVLTYVPGAGFFEGSDEFSYMITDADGETSTAAVTVTIANVAPQISNGTITTTQDSASAPFTPVITAGNGSPQQHTLVVSSQASSGSCVVSPQNATGTVVYTPNAGFSGADSCALTLTDGDGQQATATISITVNAPLADGPQLSGGSATSPLLLMLLGVSWLLRRRFKY